MRKKIRLHHIHHYKCIRNFQEYHNKKRQGNTHLSQVHTHLPVYGSQSNHHLHREPRRCRYSRIRSKYKSRLNDKYGFRLGTRLFQILRNQSIRKKKCQNIHPLKLNWKNKLCHHFISEFNWFSQKLAKTLNITSRFVPFSDCLKILPYFFSTQTWMTTRRRLGFKISVVLGTVNIRKLQIIFW